MNQPRTLSKRVWAPVLILLLVSGVVASLVGTQEPLVQTRTSHGGILPAWGAAYDLLQELGLAPLRTRAPLGARDSARTQWLVEPGWDARDLPYELAAVEQFAKHGGTVVLIGADDSVFEGLGFGAVTLPERDGGDGAAQPPDPGSAHQTPARAGLADLPQLQMHGPWLRRPRRVEVPARKLFAADAQREAEPRVRSAQGVFVLERVLSAGKIVAVSDAAFLTNEHLGNRDNAAFLIDLALALGPPVFDERCHGLLPSRSVWSALGAGFVLLATLSFAALGLCVLQRARRWPPRGEPDRGPAPPSLELFVSSLAALYRARGRGEPAAVFRAYRAGFLRRLQRGAHGAHELSAARSEVSHAPAPAREQTSLERAAARAGPAGRWLSADAAPASPVELGKAVAALERYAAATHGKRER